MPSIRIISYCLISLLFLSSCKLFQSKEERARREATELLEKTQDNRLDFQTLQFTGKAKLDLPEGSGMNNLTVNYRIEMVKDKEMLIVIRKFIEVARVHITPQSIIAYVGLNNEAHYLNYDYLADYLGQPADYKLVQNMLLGEFAPLTATIRPLDMSVNPVLFTENVQAMRILYGIDRELLRLRTIAISDTVNNRAGSAAFDAHKELNKVAIPMDITISASAPQEAKMALSHRKAEANIPIDIRFSVPEDATKIQY